MNMETMWEEHAAKYRGMWLAAKADASAAREELTATRNELNAVRASLRMAEARARRAELDRHHLAMLALAGEFGTDGLTEQERAELEEARAWYHGDDPTVPSEFTVRVRENGHDYELVTTYER